MKSRLRFFAYLVMAALFSFFGSETAGAKGAKIKMNNIEIVPSLGVAAEYNDNIFNGSGSGVGENEIDDFAYVITPGITFTYEMPGERGNISAGYNGTFKAYTDYSDQDHTAHNLNLSLNYSAPSNFYLSLANTTVITDDPYGSETLYNIGQKTDRMTNHFSVMGGYRLNDFFVELSFQPDMADFDRTEDRFQNYQNNVYGVAIGKHITSKMAAVVKYALAVKDYDDSTSEATDSDSQTHNFTAGLRWTPGGKLSGSIDVGFGMTDYDNSFDTAGRRYDENNTLIASSSLQYQPTEATSITFGLSRGVQQSGSETNDDFILTGIKVGAVQKLYSKFSLNANLGYRVADYTLGREDNVYNIGMGVGYSINDYLSTQLMYNHTNFDSSVAAENYKQNTIRFGVAASY